MSEIAAILDAGQVEFGPTLNELVCGADRFPSSSTTVGLGRSFSWCQWASINDVVDAAYMVPRKFVYSGCMAQVFKTSDM